MPVVGVFTLCYNLIVKGIEQLPHLWTIFIKLPFLIQELIFLIIIAVLLPKIFDFIDWVIAKKQKLDDSL